MADGTNWADVALKIGDIAASAAKSRQEGRAAEGTATQAQDREAILRYQAEQLAKLGGANLTEAATKDRADRFLTDAQTRARQVALGDLIANVQDVHLGGMPSYIPHMSFGGGLRPSVLGPNARQAGRSLSQQALEAQLSGSDIPNLPDVSGIGTSAPDLTPLPQSGKLDTLLQILGYAGAGAGVVNEINKGRQPGAPPEASIPRYDFSAGIGTPVGTDAAMGQPGTPMASTRPNLIQTINRLKLQQQQGGGSAFGGGE